MSETSTWKIGDPKTFVSNTLECNGTALHFKPLNNEMTQGSIAVDLNQQVTAPGVDAEKKNALIREIARELYDRFVMGGWEPQDAYEHIRGWLARATLGMIP